MKIKQFLIAVCIGSMFAACSSRDDFSQGSSKDPIVINATISGMQTRSTGDATDLQNTDFLEGAEINVYMTKNSKEGNIDGIPEKGYVTYTKGATNWTTTDVGELYWPADDGVVFEGIYPSTVTLNSGSFTVNYNQGIDENYRKSDLMYAYQYQSEALPVNLQFKHLLSKITIKVDPNGLMTQEEFINNLYGIDLKNVYRQVSIDSSFRVTATGERSFETYVEAYWDQETRYNPTNGASCIIPPQTVDGGTKFINVSIDDETSFYYVMPADGRTFEGGKEYVFNLKLVKSGLELDGISVKDWDTPINIDGDAQQ